MPNQSLLTNIAKTSSATQVYFSPIAIRSTDRKSISETYAFLAKVEPWVDNENPSVPSQDQRSIKQILKNMFVAKHISIHEICPVIERINWEPNTIYDYYRDDFDITRLDENGKLIFKFYVMNRYYQVFKCLWNARGESSTVEPYFEPGSYGAAKIFTGTDGYQWKYMYTIDSGLRTRFMDDTWLPVIPNDLVTSSLDNDAGSGNIDVITVLSGGSGYDPANSVITVSITGDGTSSNGVPFTTATASAVVANTQSGEISYISMADRGKNYTYANATIISANGSGCILGANTVSPIGGHGKNIAAELGCAHVMYSIEFNGSENGIVPTDTTYYQLGLIVNPTSNKNYPNAANGSIYRTTTDLIVSSGLGVFGVGETVWQSKSGGGAGGLQNATFTGKVLSFSTESNVIHLINTKGSLILNQTVFGESGTSRTLLSYNTPDYVIQSGYITYIENRPAITRSPDGIEQFKIVLGY
jgi:hypothetical protein